MERDQRLPACGHPDAAVAIFVMPRMLPDQPERPISAIGGRKLQEKEPLSPVREVLGYGVFAVVIIC